MTSRINRILLCINMSSVDESVYYDELAILVANIKNKICGKMELDVVHLGECSDTVAVIDGVKSLFHVPPPPMGDLNDEEYYYVCMEPLRFKKNELEGDEIYDCCIFASCEDGYEIPTITSMPIESVMYPAHFSHTGKSHMISSGFWYSSSPTFNLLGLGSRFGAATARVPLTFDDYPDTDYDYHAIGCTLYLYVLAMNVKISPHTIIQYDEIL